MIHPLAGLLYPEYVAVVGPTHQPDSQAGRLWRQLQDQSCERVAINPNDPEAVASLSHLSKQPNLVLLAQPDVTAAMVDCQYARVPLAVLPGAKKLDQQLVSGGPATRFLHTDNWGYARPAYGLHGPTDRIVPQGQVAIISQSGLVGQSMLDSFSQLPGLGCSLLAIVQPYSDVQIEELLSLLEQDQHSQVVGLYVERSHNYRLLLDTLSRMTPHKPVVLLLPDSAQMPDELKDIYAHSGVVVAGNVWQFGQLIGGLAAEAHPATNRTVTFGQSGQQPSTHWRYSSALRHLSATDNDQWLAVLPNTPRAEQQLASWRQQTSKSIDRLDDQKADQVRQAIIRSILQPRHDVQSNQLKTFDPALRRSLHQLPANQILKLPQLANWLHQLGWPVVDYQWIHNPQQAEELTKQLGWPLRLWQLDQGQAVPLRPTRSIEALRSAVYRHADRQTASWLQAYPHDTLDSLLKAERHAEYGPWLQWHPAAAQSQPPVSLLLPVDKNQIQAAAEQLRLPDNQALTGLVADMGQLFYQWPELQELSISPAITNDGVVIYDATARWQQ